MKAWIRRKLCKLLRKSHLQFDMFHFARNIQIVQNNVETKIIYYSKGFLLQNLSNYRSKLTRK